MKMDVFLARFKMTLVFGALGVIMNVGYLAQHFIEHGTILWNHLGGDPLDHLFFLLILPLMLAVGYFWDRTRMSKAKVEHVLEDQTRVARRLENVFYPSVRDIKGYRVAASFQSVRAESELGGDYYDAFSLGGGESALVIADVSGKGVQAATMAAFVKATARAYLREERDLSVAASRISAAIHRERNPERFVTLFIARLQRESGRLLYVNAGHPGPLLFKRESPGFASRVLETTAIPMGIFPEQKFGVEEINLEPGDYLALYTDGLYEFKRGTWSLEHLATLTRELLPADVEDLARQVLEKAGSNGNGFEDDAAVLALQRQD